MHVCESAELQELEILVHVFRVRNNMFAYMIVHLTYRAPQIVIHARLYANVTSPCTYQENKNILDQQVNLRSVLLTINLEPSLCMQTVFYRENIFSAISLNNIFFWVLEEKKEVLYKYYLITLKNISFSIYKNIYFIHTLYT